MVLFKRFPGELRGKAKEHGKSFTFNRLTWESIAPLVTCIKLYLLSGSYSSDVRKYTLHSEICENNMAMSVAKFLLFKRIKRKEWRNQSAALSVPRKKWGIKSLNAELNPICHLLALIGAHHILHVSRIRVKGHCNTLNAELNPICQLLALFGAHRILHVSRIRVKGHCNPLNAELNPICWHY